MKRSLTIFMIFVLLLTSLSVIALAKKGPIVDKIYFDVRMKEEIGIQDTAAGNTDVFFYGLDGPQIMGLDQATLDKLELYTIPSGSWSLMLNPIPNKAPYTWTVEDKEYFNPFAIKEVRFALNWLIDRQYIVDEILGGAGGPMFTMATPGQPGTYKYNLVASRMGMTAEGDEEKALADIESAMVKASELPENKGKLVKTDGWWSFNGEPISLQFLIRVDDPNGRVKEGEYVAQQLEKAGIKVERLLWDRVKAIKTAYYSNPADYLWHMYTEGWGAGATRAFWEHIVCQMYAPWYGYMAGGAEPSNWNYTNEKLNELTTKAYSGDFLTEDEYWETILEALELGLSDACRIYVAYSTDYYVANKESFNGRMAYGLGDGLNKWSMITANTDDGILRATQYSAKGGLFMGAWDPVGTDGFSDVYANNIAGVLYDASTFESPVSAVATSNRAIWSDVETKVGRDADGNVVGLIDVDPRAVKYDSVAKEWVEVGEGLTSMTTGTYEIRFSNFHHGISMSFADYMYANAFTEEWMNEDFEGDPYFDAEYESYVKPGETGVATVYDRKNQKFINFYDYNFPPSKERVAAHGAPSWTVSASGHAVGVTWEIVEAMGRMVAEGSVSDEIYSFSANKEGTVEVDVLRPTCVADIKAELVKMKEEAHVPASLRGIVKIREAIERYDAAIDFIADYGHAYISNGPFYLAKFDTVANYAEVRAFRDATYPFDSNHWTEVFKTPRLVIDEFDIPMMSEIGEDIQVTINVSSVIYPEDIASAATEGTVKVILITDNDEIEFVAEYVSPGVFEATIPSAKTAELAEGSYTVLAIASKEGAVPSNVSAMVIIY
ncbi:MAG: hypothetical protein KAX49_04170 [Halanaerobiales bacterium]|nr:hypothetical protein [Halanaerobiales bacterium]